jgi:hypothetical protein
MHQANRTYHMAIVCYRTKKPTRLTVGTVPTMLAVTVPTILAVPRWREGRGGRGRRGGPAGEAERGSGAADGDRLGDGTCACSRHPQGPTRISSVACILAMLAMLSVLAMFGILSVLA